MTIPLSFETLSINSKQEIGLPSPKDNEFCSVYDPLFEELQKQGAITFRNKKTTDRATVEKDDVIFREFFNLNYLQNVHSQKDPCSEANNYSEKNRYKDILPYNTNRYKFQDPALNEKTPYINASLFPSHAIVTQGPLEKTKEDFWLMVWDSNARVILMPTQLVEKGSEKCICYWPKEPNDSFTISLKDSSLRLLFKKQSTYEFYSSSLQPNQTCKGIMNTFELGKGQEKREIFHFWIKDWADDATYPVQAIDGIFKAVDNVRIDTSTPLIIHCSAGIGRSGVLEACHILNILKKEKEGCIDSINIQKLVLFLRSTSHGRLNMVKTLDQYKMIYEYLKYLNL